MRSTMPDFPLTLQHFLWRSTTLFPTKEIVTRRETGRHRYTYADFGGRVAQLAHGLKHLGVSAGDRVGTLAWNNYRHLALYFAVPGAGALIVRCPAFIVPGPSSSGQRYGCGPGGVCHDRPSFSPSAARRCRGRGHQERFGAAGLRLAHQPCSRIRRLDCSRSSAGVDQ